MISACMLLWCLGQSIAPGDRVTFTNDMGHTNRTERILPTRCRGSWAASLHKQLRRMRYLAAFCR
jgi:hypothetical protein